MVVSINLKIPAKLTLWNSVSAEFFYAKPHPECFLLEVRSEVSPGDLVFFLEYLLYKEDSAMNLRAWINFGIR